MYPHFDVSTFDNVCTLLPLLLILDFSTFSSGTTLGIDHFWVFNITTHILHTRHMRESIDILS